MDSLRKASPPKPLPKTQEKIFLESAPVLNKKNPTLSYSKDEDALFSKREKRAHHFFRWLFGFLLIIIIFGGLLFLFYFTKTLHTIQIKNGESPSLFTQVSTLTKNIGSSPEKNLRQTTDGRINILLLGRAGESYPGKNLTDTVMLMSIDTDKRKVGLISIPRDLYVTLPEERVAGKINSFYQYGLAQNRGTAIIDKAVTTLSGQPIHYTFILDFDGFEKIIDAFGGVYVNVERDIYDTRYPGKNYSYETFELKQGGQTLDGQTALKYVRERHSDPEGDFGRAKRQQQVIKAVKDKTLSNSLLFNIDTAVRLTSILGESVRTNATIPEMEAFLSLAKKIDTENIETLVIDAWKKESLLRVSHIDLGGVSAFILVPRTNNWQEIEELSSSIFSREMTLKREDSIRNENATIVIYHQQNDTRKALEIKEIISSLPGTSVSVASQARLEEWPKQSMLIDNTELQKPWTVDALMKRFSLQKSPSSTLSNLKNTIESDIIILLGSETQELSSELYSEEKKGTEEKVGDPLIIEDAL